jgi:hypothetical protein
MANIKVSQLTSATSLTAGDTFPVVQSGVTKKATIGNISTLMLSSAPQTSFRNLLINGSFIVNQRDGGSYGLSANTQAYTIDRWYGYANGGAGQINNDMSGNKRRLEFFGTNAITSWGIGQRIEGATCVQVASSNVTLSVSIQGVSTTSSITWTAFRANALDSFGTLASPTRTQIATGTFPLTSSLVRNSATFNAGVFAGTGIEIVFSGGALPLGSSVIFLDAQLEAGSVATQFEQRPMAVELAMCMRYYEKNYQYGIPAGTSTTNGLHEFFGVSNASNFIGGHIKFAVPKRNLNYTIGFRTPGGVSGSWTYSRSGVAATSVAMSAAASTSSQYGISVLSASVGAAWVPTVIGGFWEVSNEL